MLFKFRFKSSRYFYHFSLNPSSHSPVRTSIGSRGPLQTSSKIKRQCWQHQDLGMTWNSKLTAISNGSTAKDGRICNACSIIWWVDFACFLEPTCDSRLDEFWAVCRATAFQNAPSHVGWKYTYTPHTYATKHAHMCTLDRVTFSLLAPSWSWSVGKKKVMKMISTACLWWGGLERKTRKHAPRFVTFHSCN